MNPQIVRAEPGDLEELKLIEQRARLFAMLEGQDPDETYTEPHPFVAGAMVTHCAWHGYARRLLHIARALTTLKMSEEEAHASQAARASNGKETVQ